MFCQTTTVLLGRSLLRVSCTQRIVCPLASSARGYHPIIEDLQSLFTKRIEPSTLKNSSHSNVPRSQIGPGKTAHSGSDFNSNPQLSPESHASSTSESSIIKHTEPPKKDDEDSSMASSDKVTLEENGSTANIGETVCSTDGKGKLLSSLEVKEEEANESLISQLSHEGPVPTVTQTNSLHPSTAELKSLVRDLLNHRKTDTDLLFIHKVCHLSNLVKSRPELSKDLWDLGCVHFICKLVKSRHSEVRRKARTLLALLGQPPQYPKRGLRILAIDGGGTRALIPIAIMRHLERISHLDLFGMFDLVCGTSSGALCAYFMCVERGGAVALEQVCRRLGNEVFNTGEIAQKMAGFSKLFTKHAFYDSSKYEEFMKDYKKSDHFLLDTAGEEDTPKLVFVSTIVNWPALEPFVFRNYRHRPDVSSHYKGTSDVKFWEALRASSAAPGYFEEFKLAQFVHHDGALLTNNPTAVGLHEARLLWGQAVPIQCIVSLGTGKYPWVEERDHAHSSSASLVDKLQGMLTSVTDSETVHTILKDILPSTSYFRFNPIINENIPIDECDPRKLDQLLHLTEEYIDEHKHELQQVARTLQANKNPWMKTKNVTDELFQSLQFNLYHRFRL